MIKIGSRFVAATLCAGVSWAATTVPQPTLTQTVDAAIAAASTDIGGDLSKARAAVSLRVAVESYDGTMKGARGAWLTRGANSADQALLVSSLLGSTVPANGKRYAWCQLPTLITPAAPYVSPFENLDGVLSQISDPEIKKAIADLAGLRKTGLDQVASQKRDLDAALSASNVTVRGATPPSTSRHVWLQVSRDGSWVDVDPTTPTGAAPCAAAETAAALPDSMVVRAQLSVEVETKTDNALGTATAASVDEPMADLSTARIAFGFAETMDPQAERKPDAQDLVSYTPIFVIDGKSTPGAPIKLPPAVVAVGGAVGAVGDALDGPPDQATAAGPDVTAAFLSIRLVGPGLDTKPIRSEIFDRIGPAGRAAGAATAEVHPLVKAKGNYVALAAMWQIGLLTGISDPMMMTRQVFDRSTADGVSGELDRVVRAYPAAKRGLGGATTFPIVLLAGLSSVDEPDGTVGVRLTFDAQYVPSDPAGINAAQDGAVTMAAERLLSSIIGGEPPLSNAGMVFEAARSSAIPFVTIKPGDPISALGGQSADALARIRERLAEGYIVVTPQFPPSVDGAMATSWWLVDTANGSIRDEFESGRHTTMAGEAKLLCEETGWAKAYRAISRPVAAIMMIAAMAVDANGGSAVSDLAEAVADVKKKEEETSEAGEAATTVSCAK